MDTDWGKRLQELGIEPKVVPAKDTHASMQDSRAGLGTVVSASETASHMS